MKGQMDLYNFVEKPKEPQTEKEHDISNQLLYELDNPVIECANCVCHYCVNNVEELWRTVRPEEVRRSCLNCDECREYSGNDKDMLRSLTGCRRFLISDYGAEQYRKKIKIIHSSTTLNGNEQGALDDRR